MASPYLHFDGWQVVNPLTNVTLTPADRLFAPLHDLRASRPVDGAIGRELQAGLWAIPDGTDLSTRFRLKVVSLEAHSVCNQACYFCPVSVAPREKSFMPTELYERIVAELSAFRDTIEGVCMNNYNEPTVDRRFVQQVATIKAAGLPPAVLSNGSGLSPDRVDALLELGGLRYLSVNISTLEKDRYARDRGVDQLETVVRNLDYMRDKPVAEEMDLVVLGGETSRTRRPTGRSPSGTAGAVSTSGLSRPGTAPAGSRPGSGPPRSTGSSGDATTSAPGRSSTSTSRRRESASSAARTTTRSSSWAT